MKSQNRPAAASQQAAAEKSLAKAAEALEELARQTAQAQTADGKVAESPLAAAQQDAQKASQTGEQAPAQKAAENLARAAAIAAQQANQAGVQMPSQKPSPSQEQLANQPSPNSDPRKGVGELAPSDVEAELLKMGMTYADWARLPGELRDEVLQAATANAPPEYRELIRRYFAEVSRRAAATAGARPAETVTGVRPTADDEKTEERMDMKLRTTILLHALAWAGVLAAWCVGLGTTRPARADEVSEASASTTSPSIRPSRRGWPISPSTRPPTALHRRDGRQRGHRPTCA